MASRSRALEEALALAILLSVWVVALSIFIVIQRRVRQWHQQRRLRRYANNAEMDDGDPAVAHLSDSLDLVTRQRNVLRKEDAEYRRLAAEVESMRALQRQVKEQVQVLKSAVASRRQATNDIAADRSNSHRNGGTKAD